MFAPMETIRNVLTAEHGRKPIPPMDGALSPNTRLDQLDSMDLDLSAPDDIVGDGQGGQYISDGPRLLAVDGTEHSRSLVEFDTPVSALTRLDDGTLVVALDGEGLRHIDAQGGALNAASSLDNAAAAGITAIIGDGRDGVYFTIGSTRHRADEWVRDLMEGNRDGVLGHWTPGQNPKLLLRNLAFPNGTVLANDNKHLIVTESWSHNVTRYSIKGDTLGEPSTLIENMPGYPSRISAAGGGGYWLAVFAVRTQLVEMVLGEQAFKQDMMRSLEPELWVCPALSSATSHLEPLQMGGMKSLGITKPWAPARSYGLVVRIDDDGQIIDSLHSRVDGQYHGITAVREIGERLFIVSKGSHSLLVAPMDQLNGPRS